STMQALYLLSLLRLC
ncbi:secY translocase family protein, partial [Chlamydia psittaci 84-8471/1]